jgi:cobalt transporter subunit CbtB
MPQPPISQPSVAAVSQGALPAVVAIVLGVFVLFGVGFAGPSVIHNAAHDSRHSFAFPCH